MFLWSIDGWMDEIDGSIHPSINRIPSDVFFFSFVFCLYSFFSPLGAIQQIYVRYVCMYTKEIIPTYMYVLFFFFFFFSLSLFSKKEEEE